MNNGIDLGNYFRPIKDDEKRIKIITDKNEYKEITMGYDFNGYSDHFKICFTTKDIICKSKILNGMEMEYIRCNLLQYKCYTYDKRTNMCDIIFKYFCNDCGYTIKIIDFWDLDELEKHQKYFREKVWKELIEEYYSPYKKWNKVEL